MGLMPGSQETVLRKQVMLTTHRPYGGTEIHEGRGEAHEIPQIVVRKEEESGMKTGPAKREQP
jgi:hypothetical protein